MTSNTRLRAGAITLIHYLNEYIPSDVATYIAITGAGDVEVQIVGPSNYDIPEELSDYAVAEELAAAFGADLVPEGLAQMCGEQIAVHHRWTGNGLTITIVSLYPARPEDTP